VTISNDDGWGERVKLFADKGWPRDSPASERDYRSFGMNYQITELQGAVALAQLPHLPDVVRRRQERGKQLTRLLADLRGLHPQVVREGDRSVFWMYGLRAVEAETGVPAKRLSQAINAEGVACGYGYIGKPIFLYESLREKRVYGTGTFPFSLQDPAHAVRYEAGECPVTEQILSEMLTLPLHEVYSEQDVEDMAAAFEKVLRHAGEL